MQATATRPRSTDRSRPRPTPTPPRNPRDLPIDWVNALFLGVSHALALAAIPYMVFVQFSWWTVGLALLWMMLSGVSITGGYQYGQRFSSALMSFRHSGQMIEPGPLAFIGGPAIPGDQASRRGTMWIHPYRSSARPHWMSVIVVKNLCANSPGAPGSTYSTSL